MVSEEKIRRVKELADKINSYRAIGILDIYGLPSDAMQKIRKELRNHALIKVEKKSIIERAIEQSEKKDAAKLLEMDVVVPAIILINDDPFKIFKLIKKKRTPTFAKPRDKAEREVVIPAGPTDLPPGPIISELKAAGIKASIQGQNIVVNEDCKLLDEGDVVDEKIANILMKLGVKASSIGLNLVGIWEDGITYTKDVLDVDVDAYRSMVENAAVQAFNLAYNADYPVKEVVELKLVEAHQEAINLAANAEIYEKEAMDIILNKAHSHALALKNAAKIE
jgi:large subunit ribosomal protein L10